MAFTQAMARIRVRFFCADQAYLCQPPAIGQSGGQDPQVAQITPVLLTGSRNVFRPNYTEKSSS